MIHDVIIKIPEAAGVDHDDHHEGTQNQLLTSVLSGILCLNLVLVASRIDV